MEEKIEHALSLLGLNKNDRKVYVDVLKNGKSSALDISKRTGIHRTNVYDALRELEAKGFILEVVEEHKRLFLSRDPSKIKGYITQIKQEVESVLPALGNLAHKRKEGGGMESVTMSKGNFAIRDAVQSLLELNAPINAYGASREAVEHFGEGFLEHFHKKRISKKIMMRHIYNHDAPERIAFLNKMKYTEAVYLPKKFDSVVATVICKDTVLLIIFIDPPSVIIIKNKRIAEAYNKYFEILWARHTSK